MTNASNPVEGKGEGDGSLEGDRNDRIALDAGEQGGDGGGREQ